MKQKFIALFLLISIAISACGPGIQKLQSGSDVNAPGDCEVWVLRGLEYSKSETDIKFLGKLEMNDPDISEQCYQDKATAILKSKACALKANLINILKEHEVEVGDIVCRRVEAEFLYFKHINSVNALSTQSAQESPDGNTEENSALIIVGYILGFGIGSFLGGAAF